MFVSKTFRVSKVRISEKVKGVIRSYAIFDMKTNILQNFHICIIFHILSI